MGSIHKPLVSAYESERRGLPSLFPPPMDPPPPPCVWNDSYAMAHTRTYLGGPQEAFAWLRPSPVAVRLESRSGSSRNVFARMHAAQENVRRALWADVEQALARARSRPPASCGPPPPCSGGGAAVRPPNSACVSAYCGYNMTLAPPPPSPPPSPPTRRP